jgi:hypothetical protein
MVRGWALLVVGLGCGNASTNTKDALVRKDPQPMNQNAAEEIVAVTYSHGVGSGGATESIEISGDGESTLTLTFNYDGRPEIGTYRHTLPKERFEQAVRLLHAAGWEQLPSAQNMRPGQVPAVFGERRSGQKTRAFSPTPRELQEVSLLFLNTTMELKPHPSRVLRGDAKVRTTSLTKGCDLELDVTLTNAGKLPLQFSNPLHGAATEWSGLRLTVKRDGGMNEESFDFTPKDVRMDAGTPTTRTLPLAPGQAVSFAVCAKLPVGRGTYAGRLQLHNMVGGTNHPAELIDGMLWVSLGTLAVGK